MMTGATSLQDLSHAETHAYRYQQTLHCLQSPRPHTERMAVEVPHTTRKQPPIHTREYTQIETFQYSHAHPQTS